MSPLRTAILGCGHFAKRHAAILSALDQIELVAFCDYVQPQAEAYNQQYAAGRAQVFTDHAEMFNKTGLDLVYICIPPYAHDDEVELACKHGVNFLIEKPIALSPDAAQAMARQVADSKVKAQVGFMYRHGEAALTLKQLMQQGRLGTAGMMTARYACNALHSPWWRNRTKSGGQLVEQAIHLVDMTRFFFGEAVQVYSVQENLFHQDLSDYTVEDASGTVIRFASGALAVLTATNGAIPNRWDYDWRIVLKGLTADFADANHAVFHQTDQSFPETTTVAAEKDMYLAETLDLIAAIRDDRPTWVPIEEGVRSLELALAATRSAESGLPVSL